MFLRILLNFLFQVNLLSAFLYLETTKIIAMITTFAIISIRIIAIYPVMSRANSITMQRIIPIVRVNIIVIAKKIVGALDNSLLH